MPLPPSGCRVRHRNAVCQVPPLVLEACLSPPGGFRPGQRCLSAAVSEGRGMLPLAVPA